MKTKRLVLMGAVALALLVHGGYVGAAGCTFSAQPFAYEAITVSSTSIGFTSATYNPAEGQASQALITIETNPIRFRGDGTAPTATEGHVINPGQMIDVCGSLAVRNFRMIRTGSDATARVTYLR